MVALKNFNQTFTDLDYDPTLSTPRDIDLPFLEVIEDADDTYTYPDDYYESLKTLNPKAAFIASPKDAVFEQPIDHAMWTSNFWDTSDKSFPES